MIYTCDDDHEPIAYTCLHCPLCAARDEIRQWEIQDDNNRQEIERICEELRDLRYQEDAHVRSHE